MQGKTSIIKELALSYQGNVLVTTSTKVYYPDYQVNYLIENPRSNKIDFMAYYMKRNNKYYMDDINELHELTNKYDLSLIEADGSRNKPLKAYKEDPIIINNTTITIAITSLKALKVIVNEENVLRLDLFIKQVDARINDYLSIDAYYKMIELMFRNSNTIKYILFNRITNNEEIIILKELLFKVNYFKDLGITKIIYGDINTNDWRTINE